MHQQMIQLTEISVKVKSRLKTSLPLDTIGGRHSASLNKAPALPASISTAVSFAHRFDISKGRHKVIKTVILLLFKITINAVR